jgi:uncharacterized protein
MAVAPRLLGFSKRLLAILVVGYLAGVTLLYLKQRDFLYLPPQTVRTSPAAVRFPAEEVSLDTSDGERVIAWHLPAQPGKFAVIYFHGNGDVLALRVPRLREVFADGTGLVALSFRGYGGSTGHPTEQGLLADAAAAYDFAAARYPPERIAVWGFSLGTGPAVALAAARAVGKLILEAPYTSTVDVAASAFPIVPVRWLMKDQFRSDEKIKQVRVPLLVMHGERDPGISIRFGERLFALANEPKRFVRFPKGGHDDLDQHGSLSAVREFLDAVTPP